MVLIIRQGAVSVFICGPSSPLKCPLLYRYLPRRYHCEKADQDLIRVRRVHHLVESLQVAPLPGDIILWCVRWYLRLPISYAHMAEMALVRGLLTHSSRICRAKQRQARAYG